MPYLAQGTGRNQRAVTAVVVALIQGAAIVALVNGLAVKFTQPEPKIVTEGQQIPLTPIPTPMPSESPKTPIDHRDRPETLPPVPFPLPPVGGPVTEPIPYDPPVPIPDSRPTAEPIPPEPKPSFVPSLARPRSSPASWVSPDDYPARDLREGNHGVTRFALTIGADGSVGDCRIIVSSGFPGLDAATCAKIKQRARFTPATDGSGNRVAGSYSGAIRWVIPRD